MSKSDMWLHLKDGILQGCCRTEHMEPPEDAEDPDVAKAQIEAADPFDEKLKPITTDSQVVVSKNTKMQPWVCR